MPFADDLSLAGGSLIEAGALVRGAALAYTPGAGGLSPDVTFDPSWTTADINQAMWDLTAGDGGWVHFDGHFTVTEPLVRPPGVSVTVAGYPNPWSRSRTCFIRQFSGDAVWDFVDLGKYNVSFGSGRNAWHGGYVSGLQVDPNGLPGAAYRLVGGNRSVLDTIVSIGSAEYFMVIDEGRNYDGQYSLVQNFSCKEFTNTGLDVRRGSPDMLFFHGMLYGNQAVGSTAIRLAAGSGTSANANNFTFLDTHMQFTEVGLDIDSDECLYIGGSWENGSGDPLISANAVAVKVGPNVRWFVMDKTSFANKSSIAKVFSIDPAARRLRFRDLTGVNEADVPAGYEQYFDIIPN